LTSTHNLVFTIYDNIIVIPHKILSYIGWNAQQIPERNLIWYGGYSGSIGGFTRLWIGTVPTSTIGLSEDLKIDPQLFSQLQMAFYKPYAGSNWDY
jgi:hypothetical protein